MRAVMYKGKEAMVVEDVPKPTIQDPLDAIVRVTTTAICGSDLHLWHGRVPLPPGFSFTVGHEFVGVVEEVGDKVIDFKPGDRIVVAFNTSCGRCFYCKRRMPSQCERGQIFGFGQLNGTQAEHVRVPLVDTSCERIPDDLTDEQAIFVGDIFSTGFFGAENGEIKPGDSVAVVGCGPVGIFAQMSARLFGAAQVIALDMVPERLELAEQAGSIPVDVSKTNAQAEVRRRTAGRGADVVIEAVGNFKALESAFSYVRKGGVISVVGVYVEPEFPLPIGRFWGQNLTLKAGVCNTKNYMAQLIPLIQQRKVDLTKIVSHTLPLEQAPQGYRHFAEHTNRTTKVLLKP